MRDSYQYDLCDTADLWLVEYLVGTDGSPTELKDRWQREILYNQIFKFNKREDIKD